MAFVVDDDEGDVELNCDEDISNANQIPKLFLRLNSKYRERDATPSVDVRREIAEEPT